MSNSIRACLQDLAGPDICVAVAPVTDDATVLPEEAPAIARAIPKRQTEFAAGRRAARRALDDLGLQNVSIPQGPNRSPVWPKGVVGSLSHDDGLAVATVARSDKVLRLGVDLAEASDFPDHLRGQILHTPAEHAQSGLEARITFSAKECVFKAFYPDVSAYFGFDAVTVVPDRQTRKFDVTLARDLGGVPSGSRFQGGFAIVENHLITLLADRQP